MTAPAEHGRDWVRGGEPTDPGSVTVSCLCGESWRVAEARRIPGVEWLFPGVREAEEALTWHLAGFGVVDESAPGRAALADVVRLRALVLAGLTSAAGDSIGPETRARLEALRDAWLGAR